MSIYACHHFDAQKKINACLRVCRKAVGNEEVSGAQEMIECCSGKQLKKEKKGGKNFNEF